MWKKDEEQSEKPTAETTPRTSSPRTSSAGSSKATIGPSISIRGDVTGSEDLLIQGNIDGSVTLNDHSVGVGSEGRVNANITGRLITIEGRVEGDLTAQEQIILRGSAHVKGDIKAPRVVLEDGATFRGLVDMGSPQGKSDTTPSTASPSTASSSGSGTKPTDKPADPSGSKETTSPASTGASDGGSSGGQSSAARSSSGNKEKSTADRSRS